MQRKGIFVLILTIMLFAIGIGILSKYQTVDVLAKSQKYIDKHVEQYPENFVYQHKEQAEDGAMLFYYESEQYPDFVLVVRSGTSNGEVVVSDNYQTINLQQSLLNYWRNFFGDNCIVNLYNCDALNILPTIEEALSYNTFSINVAMPISDVVDNLIGNYISSLVEKEINCTIYFYQINPETYAECKQSGFDANTDEFDDYTMVIIRNGKIETKIEYE